MVVTETSLGHANDLVGFVVCTLASRASEGRYGAGGEFKEAKPHTLEHCLTARYCFYSVNRKGQVFRGEIDHPPWSLAPATYTERINTMGDSSRMVFLYWNGNVIKI